MKTKEGILRDVINETIGNPKTEKYLHHIHQDIAIKAMQEYSDQQTANLKLINERQGELIEALSAYSTHVAILWAKDINDDESKDLKLRLWHEIKRIKSELQLLQSEPTSMEMIKEVFEPIQLGESEVINYALEHFASNKAGKEKEEKRDIADDMTNEERIATCGIKSDYRKCDIWRTEANGCLTCGHFDKSIHKKWMLNR